MEVAMKQLLRGPTGRWVFSSLIVVAACSSADRPTAPRNRPQFDISDAAHLAGTAGFSFLPPIVALPAVTGTFDADIVTLNPQVAICDVSSGPDVDCGGSSAGATPAIVVYTTASTPAISIDLTGATYHVNWTPSSRDSSRVTRIACTSRRARAAPGESSGSPTYCSRRRRGR